MLAQSTKVLIEDLQSVFQDPGFPLFEAGNSEILKQNRGEI